MHHDPRPAGIEVPARPHAIPVKAAHTALKADPDGLTPEKAERRLAAHGPNSVAQARGRPWIARLAARSHHALVYVLIGSAAVTPAIGHAVDAAVILAVVVANAGIGLVQAGKAERATDAIRDMLAPRAAVLRDGRRGRVDAADLVPGDVVLLEAGNAYRLTCG